MQENVQLMHNIVENIDSCDAMLYEDCVDNEQCCICLESIIETDDSNPKTDLKCGHQFHDYCLRQWLGKWQTCPLCKQKTYLLSGRIAQSDGGVCRHDSPQSVQSNNTNTCCDRPPAQSTNNLWNIFRDLLPWILITSIVALIIYVINI